MCICVHKPFCDRDSYSGIGAFALLFLPKTHRQALMFDQLAFSGPDVTLPFVMGIYWSVWHRRVCVAILLWYLHQCFLWFCGGDCIGICIGVDLFLFTFVVALVVFVDVFAMVFAPLFGVFLTLML